MKHLFKIIGLLLSITFTQMHTATFDIVRGSACSLHMQTISALRLETFKEYPYLYIGNEEIEQAYIGGYPSSPDTLFGLAYEEQGGNTHLAGILTGVPLSLVCYVPETKAALDTTGWPIDHYYYFGEVITIKQFRNRGIATKLFNLLEAQAKSFGYKNACFISSEREADHPLKPKDYKGPDSLWLKLGYTKTDLRITYEWPTLQKDGTVQSALNVVAVWTKEL